MYENSERSNLGETNEHRQVSAFEPSACKVTKKRLKHLLELHHLVAVRELVLLLPPADPLGIGQLLRQDLDVVVGAVRVGRVRVPMLEDRVLSQTDLQLPQEDPYHPLVLDGLRTSSLDGKTGNRNG